MSQRQLRWFLSTWGLFLFCNSPFAPLFTQNLCFSESSKNEILVVVKSLFPISPKVLVFSFAFPIWPFLLKRRCQNGTTPRPTISCLIRGWFSLLELNLSRKIEFQVWRRIYQVEFLVKMGARNSFKSLKIESWWKLPWRKNWALAYFKDSLIWDLHKLTDTQDLIWLFWYRVITHWRYWLVTTETYRP